MKVLMTPRVSIAGPSTETKDATTAPREETQPESSPRYGVIDDIFAGIEAPPEPEVQDGEDVDPFLKHLSFWKGPDISAGNFKKLEPPSFWELKKEAEAMGKDVNREFLNAVAQKYVQVLSNGNNSIRQLEEFQVLYPEARPIYQNVINERREAIEKIKEELENIKVQMKIVENVEAKELENLKIFGRKVYEHAIAMQTGADFTYTNKDGVSVTEKATLKNKPNPLEAIPPVDIDENLRIGGEDSMLCIATKEVLIQTGNGEEKITITSVINKESGSPISFNEAGEIVGVGSSKNKDYNWAINHKNIDIVSKADWPEGTKADVVFKRTTNAITVDNNGLFYAPIDISIPEFVWVYTGPDGGDKTPNIKKMADGSVAWDRMENVDNWELQRVTGVKIQTARNGRDYVIKLMGAESPYTPLFTMQYVDSTEFALSLNAGHDGDIYKRTSGIYIDAANMPGKANFTLDDDVIGEIERRYGISGLSEEEHPERYNNAMTELNKGPFGLLVSGFTNVCGALDNGNNIILLEEAIEENMFDYTDHNGTLVDPALYTSALDGGTGYNAVFHKKGNLYLNRFGLVWGGQNDDKIFVTATNKEHPVYFHLRNDNGLVQVANQYEDKNKNTDDDFYYWTTDNAYVSQWYEPEMERERKEANFPDEPSLESPSEVDGKDYVGVRVANREEIVAMVMAQMNAQQEALKDQAVEETDEDDFEGAYIPLKPTEMEYEMDTFFAGWEAFRFTGIEANPFDSEGGSEENPGEFSQ